MNLLVKAAVGALLITQTAGAFAQTGVAAGSDGAVSHSRENIAGAVIVGGILVAVAAIAATGGNDGLQDTSTTPVVTPPVSTTTTTTTSTSTSTRTR